MRLAHTVLRTPPTPSSRQFQRAVSRDRETGVCASATQWLRIRRQVPNGPLDPPQQKDVMTLILSPDEPRPDGDRRRSSRVTLRKAIPGRLESGAPVEILNVSHGGLLLRAATPLPLDGFHTVVAGERRLGVPLCARIQIVHVMHVTDAAGDSFLLNVTFSPPLDMAQARILDKWMGPLPASNDATTG